MAFNSDEQYNDLPLLPPEESYWKSVDVLEQAIKANRALAELKGRLSAIPNPLIFLYTISLQEAKDSSSIENVFTTNDKLFKAFTIDADADHSTKEVLRYGKTLLNAFEYLLAGNKFSIELIENIYQRIKNAADGIRNKVVYLGNRYERIYTPPCCREVIIEKLNNWLEYANNEHDIDPLIKMALLHYQFEVIHPFTDGNGRAGRILNVLFLTSKGLLDSPILYLSRYINSNRSEYYELLRDVTKHEDWKGWIIFMLNAVEETAEYTLEKVNSIIDQFEITKELIRENHPDIYSHELLEILFSQVYSKYSVFEERGIGSRNTVSKYINKLVDSGILEKEKIGKELIFKNIALYDLFSE